MVARSGVSRDSIGRGKLPRPPCQNLRLVERSPRVACGGGARPSAPGDLIGSFSRLRRAARERGAMPIKLA